MDSAAWGFSSSWAANMLYCLDADGHWDSHAKGYHSFPYDWHVMFIMTALGATHKLRHRFFLHLNPPPPMMSLFLD